MSRNSKIMQSYFHLQNTDNKQTIYCKRLLIYLLPESQSILSDLQYREKKHKTRR